MERCYPLTLTQQRVFLLDLLEGPSPLYAVPDAVRLRGALDGERLAGAFRELVARHDGLRTRFALVGSLPVQVVAEEAAVELELVDLSGDPDPLAQALAQATAAADRPFLLEEGPLLRAALYRLGADDHLLSLTLHHALADGWSLDIVHEELAALYAGLSLAPVPRQLGDFAVWERGQAASVAADDDLRWWREQLAELPPLPYLERTTNAGHTYVRPLDPSAVASLEQLTRAEGATPYMGFLALTLALLYQEDGQLARTVGATVNTRRQPEFEGLVGLCTNTVVLPARLAPQASLRRLVADCRQLAIAAQQHWRAAFELLLPSLRLSGSTAPPFQAFYSLHERNALGHWPGLEAEQVTVPLRTAKADLGLWLERRADGLEALYEGRADLFPPERLAGLVDRLEALAARASAEADRPLAELLEER